jgi:hypothetical protein
MHSAFGVYIQIRYQNTADAGSGDAMNALFIPRANQGFLAMAISALCSWRNGRSGQLHGKQRRQHTDLRRQSIPRRQRRGNTPNALVIQNLTQPITTGAIGTSGIGLSSTNGQNTWITAGDSERRLSITTGGQGTPGIFAASRGISTTPPADDAFLNVP